MTEASRMKDFVSHLPSSDGPAHLDGLCVTLVAFVGGTWQKTFPQEAARVLPNMVRCIGRQQRTRPYAERSMKNTRSVIPHGCSSCCAGKYADSRNDQETE